MPHNESQSFQSKPIYPALGLGAGAKDIKSSSRITERVNGRENIDPNPNIHSRITCCIWVKKSAVPVSYGVCFVAASWSGVMTKLFSLICYWTIKTHVDTQKITMTGDNRALSKQLSKFYLAWRGCTNTTQRSSCGRSEVVSGSLACPGLLGVPLVPQQGQQQKKDKFPPWDPSIPPL